jgi:hypothetical protein
MQATRAIALLITAAAAIAPIALAAAVQSAQRARPAISVTGCLKTSAEPRVFLLTGAVRADEEPDAGETPAAGAAAKTDGRSYRLVPLGANVILKPYVGKKVEVGGRFMTVDELHRDESKSGSSQPAGKVPVATIAVTFIRTVAATCGDAGSSPDKGGPDQGDPDQ